MKACLAGVVLSAPCYAGTGLRGARTLVNTAKAKMPMAATTKLEPNGNSGTPTGGPDVLEEDETVVEHSVVLNTSVVVVVTGTTVVVVSVTVEVAVTVWVPVDVV